MKTLDQPAVRAEVQRRLLALRSGSARRWGKMTAHQAVMHLTDSLHAVTGGRAMDLRPLPWVVQTVQRVVALYAPVPWPRGIKTAPINDPELQGSKPVEFARDVQALLELSDQASAGQLPWLASHPMLGQLTVREWQRWAYLHFDHHLRQFGL